MDQSPVFVPADPQSETPKKKSRWWVWALIGCAVLFIPCVGLLVAVIVPQLMGRFWQAQQEMARLDIAQIVSAIEHYAANNGGQHPDTLEVLVVPDETGARYLDGEITIPLDPWKREYRYDPPVGGQSYRVYSLGKDGQPGGDGADEDLDNSFLDR